MALARSLSRHCRGRFLGRLAMVLWERRKLIDGRPAWTGLTEHYICVFTRSYRYLANHLLPVALTAEAGDGLWGTLEEALPFPAGPAQLK